MQCSQLKKKKVCFLCIQIIMAYTVLLFQTLIFVLKLLSILLLHITTEMHKPLIVSDLQRRVNWQFVKTSVTNQWVSGELATSLPLN